jgi:Tol biopolymer transport system component
MEWSPNGDKVLIRATGGITGSTDIISAGADFGKVTHLPISSSAFLSSDGNQVYYYNQGWFIVNSDGTEARPLKCDLCSLVTDPSSFVIAESPNRQWIAIGYLDGTVIIASSSNFSNFKTASVGNYVSRMRWSPDGQKLAVDVNTDASQSDVIILGMDGTVIEKLVRPEGVNYITTCGWSPDSKQTDYLAILSTGHDLYLHTLGQQKPFLLSSIESGDQSCPVWLPARP